MTRCRLLFAGELPTTRFLEGSAHASPVFANWNSVPALLLLDESISALDGAWAEIQYSQSLRRDPGPTPVKETSLLGKKTDISDRIQDLSLKLLSSVHSPCDISDAVLFSMRL